MRNIRALKLLSKPLERDVFVKNSTRELGMLACKKFSEQTKRVVNSRKQGVHVDQTVVIFPLLACLHKSTAFVSHLSAVNHV